MSDPDLQKYFSFDEADLNANQSGVITSKQRTRILEDAKFSSKFFLVGGVGIFLIGLLLGAYLLFTTTSMDSILFGIVLILLGGIIGIAVIRMGRSNIKELKLKKLEGKVNIIKETTYNGTKKQWGDAYELHIGRKTFDIESDLVDIIQQGGTYGIYYIEETKDILSMEKIGQRNKD
jgi:hypothetical protein